MNGSKLAVHYCSYALSEVVQSPRIHQKMHLNHEWQKRPSIYSLIKVEQHQNDLRR
jgi:hypothetical protein